MYYIIKLLFVLAVVSVYTTAFIVIFVLFLKRHKHFPVYRHMNKIYTRDGFEEVENVTLLDWLVDTKGRYWFSSSQFSY